MKKVNKYRAINNRAYNLLANQYSDNLTPFNIKHQEKYVLDTFMSLIKTQPNKMAKILDVGCGVGIDCLVLSNNNYDVTGVDFSKNMIKYAKKNAPKANFITTDFIMFRPKDCYDGIVMNSFIHLFPKTVTPKVLDKTRSLLVDKGILLISIASNGLFEDGIYEKHDYKGSISRYKSYWSEKELRQLIVEGGFKIIKVFDDYNQFYDKTWKNVLAVKI